ncbi:MAG: hypothetical protein WEF86_09405 [Gemmatimonadota bacterium]
MKPLRRRPGVSLVAALLPLLALPAATSGQTMRSQCAAAVGPGVQNFCGNVTDAALILQPRLGLAASGGNPVPGTASTLGMRIGSTPRFSLGLRATAADVGLPPVERVASDGDVDFLVGSVSMDAAVGVFEGFSLLPTVGGFASVDLLGSIGVVPLSRGENFDGDASVTWAVGAQVGLLRESFTAPGVTVSGMYRRLGDVTYGDATLADRDAFFSLTDHSVKSLRATVGKRVLGFGLLAGAGYDRYTGDVMGSVRDGLPIDPDRTVDFGESSLSQSRTSFFGNASFTLIILNMAVELGWQEGGDADGDATERLEDGSVFGGVSVRLVI